MAGDAENQAQGQQDGQIELLLEQALALFSCASETYRGTIQNPTKSGFLAIAEKGKLVWNAWRKKYPLAHPDFSGAIFDSSQSDFSGFSFFDGSNPGASTSFKGCTFNGKADFSLAKFSDADFDDTLFKSGVNFDSSQFEISSRFSAATFQQESTFIKSFLGTESKFLGTSFIGETFFDFCVFGENACFIGATFLKNVSFVGAKFGNNAIFDCAIFREKSDFSAPINHDKSTDQVKFLSVSFLGVDFYGDVSFRNREFQSTIDFGPVLDKKKIPPQLKIENTEKFKKPVIVSNFSRLPDFRGCKLHSDTNFDKAIFHTPPSPHAARAFRALKREMEQLKATREEQMFARLEMKAEHPNLNWKRRWISKLYFLTSDYGFSILRPALTLLVFMLIFGAIHGMLANSHAGSMDIMPASEIDWDRTLQWIRYVLINTFPVPGLDKVQLELRELLFGKNGAVVTAAMALEMLHKIISLGCVFLLGLALRNLFKMKS